MPAYAVLNSNIANSSAVTTPKLPPPPRSAQKTSGLVSLSARSKRAVGRNQLDRGHAVGRQAVLAGVPAHAAAEGVAGDPDVGGGAVQHREAVLGGSFDGVQPHRAALDPDRLGGGVDADCRHRRRPHARPTSDRSSSGPAPWPVLCGATRSPACARGTRRPGRPRRHWPGRRRLPAAGRWRHSMGLVPRRTRDRRVGESRRRRARAGIRRAASWWIRWSWWNSSLSTQFGCRGVGVTLPGSACGLLEADLSRPSAGRPARRTRRRRVAADTPHP